MILTLLTEPIASLTSSFSVKKFSSLQQASIGFALSSISSIIKIFSDPLLNCSTSFIASCYNNNKSYHELLIAVLISLVSAFFLGILEVIILNFYTHPFLRLMGINLQNNSDILFSMKEYIKTRSYGLPAFMILLVGNSITRGMNFTHFSLYSAIIQSFFNLFFAYILVIKFNLGSNGAGYAISISQWIGAIYIMYNILKNLKNIPNNNNVDREEFSTKNNQENLQKLLINSLKSYLSASFFLFLRSISRISSYSLSSGYISSSPPIILAAYSIAIQLGNLISQVCEAISAAIQAIGAKEYEKKDEKKLENEENRIENLLENYEKKILSKYIFKLSYLLNFSLTISLILFYLTFQNKILSLFTKESQVISSVKSINLHLILTQIFKSFAYASGGLLLGRFDWRFASYAVQFGAVCSFFYLFLTQPSLKNSWISLEVFMISQAIFGLFRIINKKLY